MDAKALEAKRREALSQTTLTPYQIESLKSVPLKTVRRAWFTLSHLLLEPGSIIAVMGCEDGAMPFAMATLNPDFHIIGIDRDRNVVREAKQKWRLPNLEFVVANISRPAFPDGFLDAVVDSFTLHESYSMMGYSERRVREMLDSHFRLLKHNGILFLRDYVHPPPDEMIHIELPDLPSRGSAPEDLSEADLLVRFSEEARFDNDIDKRGFFLEELMAQTEKTRLFRLSFKWAYEYILRKDDVRHNWHEELRKEYTFMTARDIRKYIRETGARLSYYAPFWDQTRVKRNYEGHFRLFDDDMNPIGYPPTSHIFVARKINDGQPLRVMERRPTREEATHLKTTAMRNSATGEITEIVSRDREFIEVLAWRMTEEGRLHIFLHDGVPRAIANAVPRKGKNIDGKRWAGYMQEAISIDREFFSDFPEDWTKDSTALFVSRHLGLKSAGEAVLETGPDFFPNPRVIDERIETRFVEVAEPGTFLTPQWMNQTSSRSLETGKIREFDAQHILNAITVGMIPNSRLEMQILALFSKLGIKAESWAKTPLHLPEIDVEPKSLHDILDILKDTSKPFKEVDGIYNQIRAQRSYFVDEGYENGTVRGLMARDVDFAVLQDETVNTAVVLPMAKSVNGDVMAGFIQDYLPVPQRHGKKGAKTIRAPSFHLPNWVKDMNGAKAFIAEKFDTVPEQVMQLGESYYMHNGITPQRIYPFAVCPLTGDDGYLPTGSFTEYANIHDLWKLIWHLYEDSFAVVVQKAYVSMVHDFDWTMDRSHGMLSGLADKAWADQPAWEIPESHYTEPPVAEPEIVTHAEGGSGSSESGGGQTIAAEDLSADHQSPEQDNKVSKETFLADFADDDPDLDTPEIEAPKLEKG